jgi:hypothetical protein
MSSKLMNVNNIQNEISEVRSLLSEMDKSKEIEIISLKDRLNNLITEASDIYTFNVSGYMHQDFSLDISDMKKDKYQELLFISDYFIDTANAKLLEIVNFINVLLVGFHAQLYDANSIEIISDNASPIFIKFSMIATMRCSISKITYNSIVIQFRENEYDLWNKIKR